MYKRTSVIAAETGQCTESARKKIIQMKKCGIYPRECFLTNPVRVETTAFIHFNTYQQLITQGKPFPEWREE